ncbi:MAG: hypothetical protein JOZ67_05665 [Gammaproteobacteria bacterium]|nr:hypothetical protein [Gammaproteobacteria bacterium]MBV9696827.1 hypothetical protein [Gammaproteobacteria bacterium]
MHDDLERHRNLQRLLRGLPTGTAPYGYAEFERRAAQRARHADGIGFARALAVAAVAVLALTPVLYRLMSTGQGAHNERPDVPHAAPPAVTRLPVQRAAWRVPQGEPALVHVGTHADVVRLQDRIARVDDLLSAGRNEGADPAQLLALQQERSRLAGTLAQVRFAEVLAYELP